MKSVIDQKYFCLFDVEDDSVEALCNNNTIPELTKSEQEMFDEVITGKECYESLSNCKSEYG